MNQHHSQARKIDPFRRPDNTPLDNDRAETGPTPLAFAEWAEAGITPPDLPAMRAHRLARLVAEINRRGWAGVLMFDPLNIRYATDCPNMQLWNTHNPFRACLVTGDGHMVLWDYKSQAVTAMTTGINPLLSEVRSGKSMFYFANGDRTEQVAREFTGELVELLAARAGTNRRLGVDKIMVHGYRALAAAGIEVMEGEELTERARAVKGADEIAALRCAVHSCERAMAEMEAAAAPGMTEDDVWAYLHAGNIRRGGEWIECRLLASGPRTNPWFQECGPRVIQDGEILAFDTDLIGPYGMCADLSRTWWVGSGGPTEAMKRAYRVAVEHIETNMAMLRPGISLRELSFGGHQLPQEYVAGRYSCRFHGVGLCDEWPLVAYPQDWRDGAFDHVLEAGMMLCVEALVAEIPGTFSIKLENQVLVTETGYENITRYPFDRRFLD